MGTELVKLNYLIIFVLAATVLLFASSFVDPQSSMDAAYYHLMVDQLEKGRGFEEPFIWQHLNDYSELVHPMDYWMPSGIVLYFVARKIAGIQGEIWLNIFLWSLLAIFIFKEVWQRTSSEFYAALASFIWVFSGRSMFYLLTTDNIAIYAFLGFSFIKVLTKDRKNPFLLGIIAGLIVLTRIEGLIIAAIGFLWIINLKNPKVCLYYLATVLLVVSPWLVRNFMVLGIPWTSNSSALLINKYQDIFDQNFKPEFKELFSNGYWEFVRFRLWALFDSLVNLVAVPVQFLLLPVFLVGIVISWKKEGRFFSLLLLIFLFLCGFIFTHQAIKGTSMHISAFFQPYITILGIIGLQTIVNKKKFRRGFVIFMALVIMGWSVFFTSHSIKQLNERYDKDNRPYRELFEKITLPESSNLISVYPVYVYLLTGLKGSVASFNNADSTMKIAERYNCSYIIIDKRSNLSKLSAYEPLWQQIVSHNSLILLKKNQ
jgi:hypothetical protein